MSPPIVLEYAGSSVPAAARVGLGACAAVVAVGVAGWIVWASLGLADSLVAYTTCGGRGQTAQLLYFGMPACMAAPLVAWVVAKNARFGVVACRCGLWGSVAGWLTSVVFTGLS